MATYRFTYELTVEADSEEEAIHQVREMYSDDFREFLELVDVEEVGA